MPGIKPDVWIRRMAQGFGMIEPFEPENVRERVMQIGSNTENPTMMAKKIISYGTSSYGYDMRIADEFKVFTPTWAKPGEAVVDPKNLDAACMVDFKGDICRIPPNSFALCRSLEKFKIPRDVLCVVLGKSTYARCGIIVNVTPLEPEWEGHVTIEISNTTPLPAKIYANEGIAQVLFFQTDVECQTSYGDKHGGGKYQNQGPEIVLPRM